MDAFTGDDIIVETERVLVRPWRHEEAPRLLDILSRLEVVRWLGDATPKLMQTLDEAHARIDRLHALSTVPPLGYWAVVPKATGVPAGSVLLLTLPRATDGEVEIGWNLHPDSWGHGYATEAAVAVLAHGFAGGLPAIWALTDLENAPSQAVCRRLGMTDTGVAERWYDGPSRIFRVSSEEWAARRDG